MNVAEQDPITVPDFVGYPHGDAEITHKKNSKAPEKSCRTGDEITDL